MKKIYVIGACVAATTMLFSCSKENNLPEAAGSRTVTIRASYENPVPESDTKVSILADEVSKKFSLSWEGSENMTVASSSNNSYKTFTMSEYTDNIAVFTGELPAIEEDATTNYFGVVSEFASSAANTVRGEIAANQTYDPTSIGKAALLVARQDGCTVGEAPEFIFKTMNAFLRFPLVKGAAAAGSSNTYTKMYVQNVVVEAIGEETIAGRFGISKTDADWTSSYAEVVDANKSTSVSLNCVTSDNPDGLELTSTATEVFLAIAFGTYSQGLKVTVNVKNQDGDFGKMVAYISKDASVTIGRNKMVSMPSLTVNPADDTVVTYSIVENPVYLEEETYYLAAKYTDGTYHLATGALASSKDLATSAYTYNPSTKILTGSDAATVTLEKTTGGYYVKFEDKYLSAKSSSNRSLQLSETKDVWEFGVDARGGMTMKEANFGTYLLSAAASSAYLRNYGVSTNGNYGVYLFKAGELPTITKTLESIKVTGLTTTYSVGDTFSFDGTVYAVYNDASEEDVTSDATITGTVNTASAGTYTLTISYSGKTTTVDITVMGSVPVYSLYSGAITEGDYIIVYDGDAMNTTIDKNRMQFETVTITDDKITNPSASIVWHIAANGSYWTLYNADDDVYAAGNGTKNQIKHSDDETADESLWTVTGTETYEFVNKKNSEASVNCNLRKNGTYGFACYGTNIGGALSLYKKN